MIVDRCSTEIDVSTEVLFVDYDVEAVEAEVPRCSRCRPENSEHFHVNVAVCERLQIAQDLENEERRPMAASKTYSLLFHFVADLVAIFDIVLSDKLALVLFGVELALTHFFTHFFAHFGMLFLFLFLFF
jgi:hypothetical protein